MFMNCPEQFSPDAFNLHDEQLWCDTSWAGSLGVCLHLPLV